MHLQRLKYKDLEQTPQLKINQNFKVDFFGSAPAPFIGRFGYPHVNIGILSPQFSGDTSIYDSPKSWSQNNSIQRKKCHCETNVFGGAKNNKTLQKK